MTHFVDSSRVEDQTSEEWRSEATCFALDPVRHSMVSRKTGSKGVPYVEICEHCGWIDPRALTLRVESSIKEWMTQSAQRIAVATETEPFAIVQPSSGDVPLREVLTQGLAAAFSIGLEQGFNDVRMRQILDTLQAEVERHVRMERSDAMRSLQLAQDLMKEEVQ